MQPAILRHGRCSVTDGTGIGVTDLYRIMTELNNTMQSVIRHLERVDTRNEYADKFHADVEARIRVIESIGPVEMSKSIERLSDKIDVLERYRYTLMGISSLVSIVFSAAAVAIFSTVLHK